MGIFGDKTKFVKKEDDYEILRRAQARKQPIQERPLQEMEKEYKQKHPGMMDRWLQKRQEKQEFKQETHQALKAEYRKAYIEGAKQGVRARGRQEGQFDYGRTRKQKMRDMSSSLNDMTNFLGGPQKKNQQQQQHQQHQGKRHGKSKNKKKHHPQDPFDTSALENIGGFEF